MQPTNEYTCAVNNNEVELRSGRQPNYEQMAVCCIARCALRGRRHREVTVLATELRSRVRYNTRTVARIPQWGPVGENQL